MINLKKSKIAVYGGSGFLAGHLKSELTARDLDFQSFSSDNFDFVADSFPEYHIACDCLFNLCGFNGGLEFNKQNKSDIFFQNTVMNLRLLEAAKKARCQKVLSTLASCAYSSDKEELFPSDLMKDAPHSSVSGHGYAKRNVYLMSKLLSEDSNTNCICVCPTTVFGPGDSLNPSKAKVMGSLILKFLKAKQSNEPFVQLLGDGRPMRHFIYVKDLAKLLVEAMESYEDYSRPLHLASPKDEYTIKQLAEMVKEITAYEGKIVWGDPKDNGQYRKRLEVEEEVAAFNFTPFETALEETVRWYEDRLV